MKSDKIRLEKPKLTLHCNYNPLKYFMNLPYKFGFQRKAVKYSTKCCYIYLVFLATQITFSNSGGGGGVNKMGGLPKLSAE